ncbi:MAG: hypothetical protein KA715_06030 [Xanthomonadaceae bacterium]|nr:hypothetical protein [Xanthomonadaceae bacterium]
MAKKNVKTKTKSATKPAKAAKAAPKAKPVGKIAKAVKAVKAAAAKLTGKPDTAKAPKAVVKSAGKNVKVEIQAVVKSTKSAVSVKGGKIKVTETEVVAVAVQTKGAKAAGKKGEKSASSGSSRSKSLTNSCREMTCDLSPTSAGYCRAHYIKNWKKIKRKEAVLKDGKLNQYVEELISKYPEKYIEAIRFDLANDKEFMKVIRDLELDEAIDDVGAGDDEAPEAVAVEGVSSRRGADLDDDSDIF